MDFDIDYHERRTVAVLNSIPPSVRDAGINWYPDAHKFAAALARLHQLDVTRVAGMLAAFSIRTQWNENKQRTVDFLNGISRGMHLQCDKAYDVGLHPDCDDETVASILNGPKIVPFWHNIMYPLTSRMVTIDSHIADFYGVPYGKLSRKYGHPLTIRERLTDMITRVADTNGYRPLEVQAIIWVAHRGGAE